MRFPQKACLFGCAIKLRYYRYYQSKVDSVFKVDDAWHNEKHPIEKHEKKHTSESIFLIWTNNNSWNVKAERNQTNEWMRSLGVLIHLLSFWPCLQCIELCIALRLHEKLPVMQCKCVNRGSMYKKSTLYWMFHSSGQLQLDAPRSWIPLFISILFHAFTRFRSFSLMLCLQHV